jgi:hypothetical protein
LFYKYQLVKRILYVFTVYKYRPEEIVSKAVQIVQNPADSTVSDADQLGTQITELCSIITGFTRVGLFAKSLPLARSASRTGENESAARDRNKCDYRRLVSKRDAGNEYS